MIKASIDLQDLRRRIYVEAKADSAGTDGVGSGCTKREITKYGTTRNRKCCQSDRSHNPWREANRTAQCACLPQAGEIRTLGWTRRELETWLWEPD